MRNLTAAPSDRSLRSSHQPFAETFPVFLATAAAIGVVVLQLPGPPWTPLLSLVPAAAVAWFAGRTAPEVGAPLGAEAIAVTAVGLAWAFAVFGGGGILPPGDAIAVPQFAREIAGGRTLTEAFPPGSSGHAYPPGYPLLFSLVSMGLTPTAALVAFKVLTILIVGLIPAAWARMHLSLFFPTTPAWMVFAASYLAFVVLERHLGFLTAFAGKNAVQFALLVFPAVATATLRLARARILWMVAALPLFGLFLIHYSMVHLSAAFLGAYLVAGRKRSLVEALRIAAAGALAVGLLILVSGAALADPRAATSAWTPAAGLVNLMRQAIAAKPEVVVFHDAAFGVVPSFYRLPLMVSCSAFAFLVGRRLAEPALWRAAATYGLAFAASLAIGYGLVPLRLSVDFMRCFVWALQAAILTTTCLAALALLPRPARPLQALLAGGVALLSLVAARDAWVEHRVFARRTLAPQDVRAVSQILPARGPCFLIAESDSRPEVMTTTQHATAWNYAEAVSPCRFLTGSWVQPGSPGGRDLDGLPAAGVLQATPRGSAVFFSGDEQRLDRYRAELRRRGLDWTWTGLSADAGGAAVWRAVPPPSNDPSA
jgi:hypothetical protein